MTVFSQLHADGNYPRNTFNVSAGLDKVLFGPNGFPDVIVMIGTVSLIACRHCAQ